MLSTPFGNIIVFFDGSPIECRTLEVKKDKNTSIVDGSYLIEYDYVSDGNSHNLSYVLVRNIDNSCEESGERL